MSFWTAMVVIVGMMVLWGILDSRNKHSVGRSARKMEDGAASQRETELKAEIEQLRERLHVLERIATDDREARRIAAEIESLRNDDEAPAGKD